MEAAIGVIHFEDGGRGGKPRWPLEGVKGKEADAHIGPSEGTGPADPLTVAL